MESTILSVEVKSEESETGWKPLVIAFLGQVETGEVYVLDVPETENIRVNRYLFEDLDAYNSLRDQWKKGREPHEE